MVNVSSSVQKSNVSITHVIEHVHVIGDKHAVKISINYSPDDIPWLVQKLKPESKQFILTRENLNKLLSDEEYNIESRMVVVSDDFLAIAQEKGYVYATDKFKLDFNTVFEDCRNLVGKSLISDYASGHMLFSHDGTVLPTAIKFSNYYLSDGRFAIHDLHKTLSELPLSVLPYLSSITAIPYYNVSPSQSVHISATFQPTAEQMILIWEKAQKMSKQYPSSRLLDAVIALDILWIDKHKI